MGFSRGPKIVTDGLVLALDAGSKKSYPDSGNTWSSLTNSYDGTLTNGPTFNSTNGVIEFDGTDDYISFPSDSQYRLTTNMTFSFRFNWNAQGAGQTLMTRGPQSSIGFYWIMIYSGRPYFQFRKADNSGYLGLHSSTSLSQNTWYTWDIVVNGTDVIMYIDGAEFESWDVSSDGIGLAAYDNEIRIGSYASSMSTWFYSGDIGYARIYNRSLSIGEIQQNYNAQKSRFI
jgi:hypothetical protein